MRVLGIETSCDDTGIALYDSEQGLLAHALYSQIKTHQKYGGVVPELAARDHVRKVIPLVDAVMEEAGVAPNSVDGIAYTSGPGLAGALLAGSAIAKGLAFAWDVPTVGVHHMEGHMLAPMLEEDAPDFPFIALLVSGGHTLLARVQAVGEYEILGMMPLAKRLIKLPSCLGWVIQVGQPYRKRPRWATQSVSNSLDQ